MFSLMQELVRIKTKMRCVMYIAMLCGCIVPLSAAQMTKSGAVPTFTPYEVDKVIWFLPYNPTILIVGDPIVGVALEFARKLDCSQVFCVSSDPEDFADLQRRQKEQGVLKIDKDYLL